MLYDNELANLVKIFFIQFAVSKRGRKIRETERNQEGKRKSEKRGNRKKEIRTRGRNK